MNIIVACDHDNGIGKNGTILWHYPEDLKYFRIMTMGKTIIMGRKTWDSLPRRPLPGRRNIVLTRNPNFTESESFNSLEAIPNNILVGSFIIGGAQIYAEALKHPLCRTVYITRIPGSYGCDTFFTPYESNDITYVIREITEKSEKNICTLKY